MVPGPTAALEVMALFVRYREFTLGPLSVALASGDFVSLIGPNGSGKSTLIRSVLGLNANASRGRVLMLGHDAAGRQRELFSHVGYVTDSPRDVLAEFTAQEYWDYCRLAYESARGLPIRGWNERAAAYARALDLPARLTRPISALSRGTARKVQLIAALLPDPKLLVLDEPSIGLDFLAARSFEAILTELRSRGTTVLAASHDLDLAARIATRILVLYDGQIVADEQVDDLTEGVEHAVAEALSRARGEAETG